MKNLWNKFWGCISFYYWDGISCGALTRQKEFDEFMKRSVPTIRQIQRDVGFEVPNRYGCPQDYKDAQDFIDHL